MAKSITAKKSKTLIIIIITLVVLLAAFICVMVLQHDDSSSPANDTNNIAARQTDPNRPFVGITDNDIKSAYIRNASYGEIYLSTDEISKMLNLASQIWIDPEKGEKWSLPVGGPSIIFVDLKDGRTLKVGGFTGNKDSSPEYYYNGLEYDGDYDLCEKLEMLMDYIQDNDPGYQKFREDLNEKLEKEQAEELEKEKKREQQQD